MDLDSTQPTPRNVRSSGPLVAANSDDGVALFTGYDLERGDVRSARVMILNAGSRPGRFTLEVALTIRGGASAGGRDHPGG